MRFALSGLAAVGLLFIAHVSYEYPLIAQVFGLMAVFGLMWAAMHTLLFGRDL